MVCEEFPDASVDEIMNAIEGAVLHVPPSHGANALFGYMRRALTRGADNLGKNSPGQSRISEMSRRLPRVTVRRNS